MAFRNQPNAVTGRGSGKPRVSVRRRSTRRQLGVLAVLLGLVAVGPAGAARAVWRGATASRGWKIAPTPNPVNADISVLASASCPSQRACTAVGSSAHSLSSPTRPLAERWDGTRWRIEPTPTPRGSSDTLFGVSCPSVHACVAVGSAFYTAGRRQRTLTEAWNGRRWRVQPTPQLKPPSSLYAVSCTSARRCVAVGHTLTAPGRAIVESWNGTRWHLHATPQPVGSTQLAGVSCSSARACTAVGWRIVTGDARPLALSWNGATWKVHAVPLPHRELAGMFDAVSCTSATACTATGTDFNPGPGGPTLAERWNGKTWRVERTPNPANISTSSSEVTLNGVSCSSAKSCTAIGEYTPGHAAAYFIESWNGRRWRLEPAPHPAHFAHGALLGVSCASSRCAAVGAYAGLVHLQVTLAMTG